MQMMTKLLSLNNATLEILTSKPLSRRHLGFGVHSVSPGAPFETKPQTISSSGIIGPLIFIFADPIKRTSRNRYLSDIPATQ